MIIRNLFFLLSTTVVAFAAFTLSLYNYNPFQASFIHFSNFYLSLLVFLGGLFALVLIYVRTRNVNANKFKATFFVSLRQSFLISLCLVSLLILKGLNLLDIWIAVPLVLTILVFELFFKTKSQSK